MKIQIEDTSDMTTSQAGVADMYQRINRLVAFLAVCQALCGVIYTNLVLGNMTTVRVLVNDLTHKMNAFPGELKGMAETVDKIMGVKS